MRLKATARSLSQILERELGGQCHESVIHHLDRVLAEEIALRLLDAKEEAARRPSRNLSADELEEARRWVAYCLLRGSLADFLGLPIHDLFAASAEHDQVALAPATALEEQIP